jgi:hypothetical protein
MFWFGRFMLCCCIFVLRWPGQPSAVISTTFRPSRLQHKLSTYNLQRTERPDEPNGPRDRNLLRKQHVEDLLTAVAMRNDGEQFGEGH